MENTVFNELLKEYEKKRINSQKDLEERKKSLFSKNPDLQKIEDELNQAAILTAKSILNNNDPCLVENLQLKINNLNNKKNKILEDLNIAPNYLQPQYECSICNDTGYVITDGKTSMCPCLKQHLFNIQFNQSNISNLDKDSFEKFNINYYSDKVDVNLYNSNISPRENIKVIKNISENFIKNFDNKDEKNLLFIGNTGLGKTFLSNCIANELLKKDKVVLYQTAPVMLDKIIDARFDKPGCNKNIIENIYTADLLIIDDLGTETMNNIKFTELFNIINTRLLNQSTKATKTIISTNLNMQNLFSVYDERIISRFVGYYNICRFFGEDIRFKKAKSGNS